MSFTIKQILTPVDFSETSQVALSHAIFMAKIYNAKLYFIHVMEKVSYQNDIRELTTYTSKITDMVEGKLEELATSIRLEHGINKPEIIIESGNIASRIVETAEQIKADIIVMGTHGISGVAEFFMGSNAYKVVTQATCPVLTVQKQITRKGFNIIVLPIDDSHSSRQKVKYAVDMAKQYSSVVHVLGLMKDEEPSTRHKSEVMMKQVNEFLEKHEIPKKNKTLVGDNAAKLTMKYANDVNADLIMIMTEQEENITGYIMGPYAQQVVNHSKVPVMSITPKETYVPIGGM